MFTRLILLIFILLLVPVMAGAEYYKYRDENGAVRFTDNLLDVPKDQRQTAHQYNEIKTGDTETEDAVDEKKKKPANDLQARTQSLKAEQDQLIKTYKELEKEGITIARETKNPKDDAEYTSFKIRVNEYNARVKAYESQRNAFQEKVDAFNDEVETE